MEHLEYYTDDLVNFLLEITENNVGVTGQSPSIYIRRLSDSNYWTGSVWQAGVSAISMLELSATDWPGLYWAGFTFESVANRYFIRKFNTGGYALDEYMFIRTRLRPLNEVAGTRTSVSPASSTFSDKLEEIHAAVAGKIQLTNGGAGSAIQMDIYNYAETDIIKSNTILKPAGTANTQTLDANSMAGREDA